MNIFFFQFLINIAKYQSLSLMAPSNTPPLEGMPPRNVYAPPECTDSLIFPNVAPAKQSITPRCVSPVSLSFVWRPASSHWHPSMRAESMSNKYGWLLSPQMSFVGWFCCPRLRDVCNITYIYSYIGGQLPAEMVAVSNEAHPTYSYGKTLIRHRAAKPRSCHDRDRDRDRDRELVLLFLEG